MSKKIKIIDAKALLEMSDNPSKDFAISLLSYLEDGFDIIIKADYRNLQAHADVNDPRVCEIIIPSRLLLIASKVVYCKPNNQEILLTFN